MKPAEIMVLLLCAIVAVVMLGRRFKIPYPIALVLGGLCISLIPGLPRLRVNPDLVFFVFLPPLLYAAGWFTSWHDFKENARPISLLAVGLVLFTTIVTGFVLHALIPDLPLAAAFAFGAIVSPPDAVAATAIAQEVHLPRRIVTVLEGESLVNDATGLVALRFALAAMATGYFSLGRATIEFVIVVAGGVVVGLAVGLATAQATRLIKEDLLLITVSFLAPYAAYLTAERLHVSGVLAAVTAGIHGGWKGPELLVAGTRLKAGAVWNMVVFLLNCILFILIGLQLPDVLHRLGHHSWAQLIGYAVLASGVVILVRPVWVFPATWLPRLLSPSLRRRDPTPPWRYIFIVGWSGMRGVVSLGGRPHVARELPQRTRFSQRDLLIFLAFCVVLATLVFQGLTLPWLIRWLGVRERHNENPEREARLKIARAALAYLNEVATRKTEKEEALQPLIARYEERARVLDDELVQTLGWSPDLERMVNFRRLSLEALKAERRELIKLRRARQVDEELMHRIENELDLEETRFRA